MYKTITGTAVHTAVPVCIWPDVLLYHAVRVCRRIFLITGEENMSDKTTHNTTEQEQNAPDGKKQCDDGLGGRSLINGSECAVGCNVVEQKIGKNKQANRKGKGPTGKEDEFLFHENTLQSIV